MKTVLKLIADERARQISKGYDAAHDDGHRDGTLFKVASALLAEGSDVFYEYSLTPADSRWADALIERLKGDRQSQLLIAATLIVAELERVIRVHQRLNTPSES